MIRIATWHRLFWNPFFQAAIIFFSIPLLPVVTTFVVAGGEFVVVHSPMSPPEWALLERRLLKEHEGACREFFNRYFDERGYLLCVERWGGNDGPDDAIESCNDWPLVHALGGANEIFRMSKKAWEGHLRQYTAAKTVDVPIAREGMYFKEFPTMFDWTHNGEGLNVFNSQGLSDPSDPVYIQRMRRYAGFYMNEDPGAPNFDPQHKIIRSLLNGSRGPLLRKATALDWAGDPIEVENRFLALHGERNYDEMLAHFKDYNDIVGDHPQNLCTTSLALNAFMLTHEKKYTTWLLDYVDAWRDRMIENNGVIPTNIGLDGTIGGACEGKWYGGVYGWAFSVVVPQTGKIDHRNTHHLGLNGFGNAFLLTGEDRYIDVWRKMIATINRQKKVVDGVEMFPTMFGDDGWYAFRPSRYSHGANAIYFWSMKPEDRAAAPANAWFDFLEGKNAGYPVRALRAGLASLRNRVSAMRDDRTTPDTRLADDPMQYNPATVEALIRLMLGGLPPSRQGGPLHCRLRYFDPASRRAGVPPDVAALVTGMTPDTVTVVLVNVGQVDSRDVLIQLGAYREHEGTELRIGNRVLPIAGSVVPVRLAPGCGAQIVIGMRRYANSPTLQHPWNTHAHE